MTDTNTNPASTALRGCCGATPVEQNPSKGSGDDVRAAVREGYARAAEGAGCCGEPGDLRAHAESIGYTIDDLEVTDGNLGLGCGNPTALASLKPGETVVDLGSGGGFDAFIAARQVGADGRVIGVDMTPEMLERARASAVELGLTRSVEFREGIIEALPIVADSVDVLISNCVINLSPDKPQVFREAFRVLKSGGRLAVSDIVLSEPLPDDIVESAAAIVACVGGASTEQEYVGAIEAAGFQDVRFTRTPAASLLEGTASDPVTKTLVEEVEPARLLAIAETVWSYKIEARKP